MSTIIRRLRFSPYRAGNGPTFCLTVWDLNQCDHYGKSVLGYRLRAYGNEKKKGETIFLGRDFSCAPSHAIDSDETVVAIMSFLTLRPGDTDREYFASYTPSQLEFCAAHAQALSSEVQARFPDCE